MNRLLPWATGAPFCWRLFEGLCRKPLKLAPQNIRKQEHFFINSLFKDCCLGILTPSTGPVPPESLPSRFLWAAESPQAEFKSQWHARELAKISGNIHLGRALGICRQNMTRISITEPSVSYVPKHGISVANGSGDNFRWFWVMVLNNTESHGEGVLPFSLLFQLFLLFQE